MLQYLVLILLTEITAKVLCAGIKDFFNNMEINIADCFLLATDGAANLSGVNNSVGTLMKQHNPALILVKCVCHLLHLACSHAAKELPSSINYNWFYRLALCCESYMLLYTGCGRSNALFVI